MSIPVELNALAEAAAAHPFAYLLTVSDDGRPHAVACAPAFEGATLVVPEAGRRTSANAGVRSNVSLVYPPAEVGGYSLIVDADATVVGTDVHLAPAKAVLHRPAPGAEAAEGSNGSCGSDCVPVALDQPDGKL